MGSNNPDQINTTDNENILLLFITLFSTLLFSQKFNDLNNKNKPVEIGTKWCDISKLENGILTFTYKGNKKMKSNIAEELKKSGLSPKITENDIHALAYTNFKENKGMYLIFKSAIILTIPYLDTVAKFKTGSYNTYLKASDSSKIFTHDGAIILAKDGSIIATTPTTILIITPAKSLSTTYKGLFGNVAPLAKPYFKLGRTDKLIDEHDKTFADPKGKMKVQINLDNFHFNVLYDSNVEDKVNRK